jgi:hypothetical protein
MEERDYAAIMAALWDVLRDGKTVTLSYDNGRIEALRSGDWATEIGKGETVIEAIDDGLATWRALDAERAYNS